MDRKVFNFDVETTGLYANIHGITQLAFVVEINDNVVEERDFLIRPFETDEIDDDALAIKGRTLEEIMENGRDPESVHSEIVEILSMYVDKFDAGDKFYPCGYNIAFDTNFLIQFFKKNGDNYLGSWLRLAAQIDPLYILRMLDFMGKISMPDYKLESVANALDIEINAHNALSDIKATIEIRKIVEELITCD